MENIFKIELDNNTYISADELFDKAPTFCRSCRNAREIIKRNKIPENQYVFCREDDDVWVITDGSSRKMDKVFISKTYATEHIPELVDKLKLAPPLLDLKDCEKFRDIDGNIINIEVRGERIASKCYFLVNDISKGFGLKRLRDTLMDNKNINYEEGTHYEYFICKNTSNAGISSKKKLYLTYNGLLRVLFVSRSLSADKVALWASETLFKAHLGTYDDKCELAGELLDINSDTIKSVFNKSLSTMPCIYLFKLGDCDNKKIRRSFEIDKTKYTDHVIAKFGLTNDLPRRSSELHKKYSKYNGVNIKLIFFQYIDPIYLYDAETSLKRIITKLGIKHDFDTHKELILYDQNSLSTIKEQYELIGNKYRGRSTELINMNRDLEFKLKLSEQKVKIIKQKNVILTEKYENLVLNNKIKNLKKKQKSRNN